MCLTGIVVSCPQTPRECVMQQSVFTSCKWWSQLLSSAILAAVLLLLASYFESANATVPSGFLSANDEVSGNRVVDSDQSAIVLIHGWNPGNASDMYSDRGACWPQVNDALKLRLFGSKWRVLKFRWESDAATGMIIGTDGKLGNESVMAARNADANGPGLANQLSSYFPNLREVVFIAHSAGAWAALVAAEKLLQANDYVVPVRKPRDPRPARLCSELAR